MLHLSGQCHRGGLLPGAGGVDPMAALREEYLFLPFPDCLLCLDGLLPNLIRSVGNIALPG
jgi:hypothetical protein